MSRIIKFRAWDKKRNKFDERFPREIKDFGELGLTLTSNDFDFMQFTGLYDKNGKEIYEGDIMYRNTWRVPLDDNHHADYAVIKFIDGCFEAVTRGEENGTGIRFCTDKNPIPFYVIGNIYENPKLLTK